MLGKALVDMLPSDRYSHLYIHAPSGELCFNKEFSVQSSLALTQHLYFTTDEEIKEGDLCIYHNKFGASILCQAYKHKDDRGMLFDDGTHNREIGEGITPLSDEVHKVVATTNPDLWKQTRVRCSVCKASGYDKFPDRCSICSGSGVIIRQDGVAKIDTDFIEAHVREQGKITEVLLEYEQGNWYAEKNLGYRCLDCNYVSKEKKCKCAYKLKLRNNGTVIIKPVGDMTEKEVMHSILAIIKEERDSANLKPHTSIGGWGYTQFERNIAQRVYELFKK